MIYVQRSRPGRNSRGPASGETLNHRLRAIVHRTGHVRLPGTRGAQIDDATALGQIRQHRLRQQECSSRIEVDVLVPFLERHGLERRHDGDASIVDEDVDFVALGLLEDLGD